MHIHFGVLKLTNFTFRIDDETVEEMKKYEVNWSDIIRQAIMEKLEQMRRYKRYLPEGFLGGQFDTKIIQ